MKDRSRILKLLNTGRPGAQTRLSEVPASIVGRCLTMRPVRLWRSCSGRVGTRRQNSITQAQDLLRFIGWFSPPAANAHYWAAESMKRVLIKYRNDLWRKTVWQTN